MRRLFYRIEEMLASDCGWQGCWDRRLGGKLKEGLIGAQFPRTQFYNHENLTFFTDCAIIIIEKMRKEGAHLNNNNTTLREKQTMKYYVDKAKFEQKAADLIKRLDHANHEMIYENCGRDYWDELLNEIDYLVDDFAGLIAAYRETEEEEGGNN